MAEGAVIGALRVVLGADTVSFEEGLKGAGEKLEHFAGNLGKIAAGIAIAIGAAATTLGIAVLNMTEKADELGKMAQKVGIPVEELSKLRLAADLSHVSMDTLATSLGKLSKNMVEAMGKPTTETARALGALNISLKGADGQMKSSSQILQEVATKFKGMEDGAGKTAIAMALFGKAGKEMIPLLNSGGDGIAKMKKEAEELGLVISTKTYKASEEFNDNLIRLGKIKEGIITQVTARFVPAMEAVSHKLVDAAKEAGIVARVSEGLSRTILFLIDNFRALAIVTGAFIASQVAAVAVTMTTAFLSLARAISLTAIIKGILNAISLVSIARFAAFAAVILYFTDALPAFNKALNEVGGTIKNMMPAGIGDDFKKGLKAIGLDIDALEGKVKGIKTSIHGVDEEAKKVKAPLIGSKEDATNIKKLGEEIDKLGLQARILNGDFIKLAPGFVEAANSLKLFGTHGRPAVTTAEQLSAKLKPLNDAMERFKGAQLKQEALLPYEVYAKRLDELKARLDAGGISQETFGRLIKKTAEDAGTAWNIAGASIAGSFADIAGSFGTANSSMALMAKAFSIVQAVISAYTGAAKALELPFPANIAAAAAVLAKGFAFVAAIQSQAVPKFAQGGSFTVPGGIGGQDRMMQIAAFPGERVTVETPEHQRRGGGAIEIKLKGVGTRDWLRGDVLRELVDSLNTAHGDGYRLKFT